MFTEAVTVILPSNLWKRNLILSTISSIVHSEAFSHFNYKFLLLQIHLLFTLRHLSLNLLYRYRLIIGRLLI